MSPDASAEMRALRVLGIALLAALPAAAAAAPRSHPVIAGSSTMFPFAAAVAERWPGAGPLVLPMGSGAGIAWFCEGIGPQTPDIVLASREMTPEEASGCRIAGATPKERILVGHDGIVLATSPAGPAGALQGLTLDELWRAVAVRVPDPSGARRWIANPYRLWSELRATLPAEPIRVLGPPATSGTRDALVALALRPACEAALRGDPTPDAERRHCGELRRDGAWQDAGENDDALVARLSTDHGALGVVGFGALARHPGRVAAVCLDGTCPAAATIRDGAYPLARPLYLYLKTAHRSFLPGLDELVSRFFAPEAVGPDGYLVRLGLIPAATAPLPADPAGRHAPSLARGELAARLLGLAVLAVLLALAGGTALMRRAAPARIRLERAVAATLWSSAGVTAALLVLVLATLIVPALQFFMQVSPLAFLGGTHWSPESAIRAAQVVGEGAFGVLPVLLGSVMVAAVALLLAVPLALAAALHGHAWSGTRRQGWRFGFRLAALVPAVLYGLFAALTAGPAIALLAGRLGLHASAQSTLAAGLVVGIMLLPVLAVRIGEALEAVPPVQVEAALGLGATRWEVLRDIVLPVARPGIGAALLLALTRALGETVIVLMAAGLVASWSLDPLGATTTLTAQIVGLMSGTHALEHVRTQLPFVLGLFLAMIVLPLNAWALRLLRRSHVTPSPVF